MFDIHVRSIYISNPDTHLIAPYLFYQIEATDRYRAAISIVFL